MVEIGRSSAINPLREIALNRETRDAVKEFTGITKQDLRTTERAFTNRKIDTPDGIAQLKKDFVKYDTDYDRKLSIEELVEFAKREKVGLIDGSMSLIGAGEGVSRRQLETLYKLNKESGVESEQLKKVIDKFKDLDKDEDRILTKIEYDEYARRNSLEFTEEKVRDKTGKLEDALVARMINAYTQNKDSTNVGFLSSLFVA